MYKIIATLFCVITIASCSLNNTKEDSSLGKYFEENNVTGTFALFNNGTGEFTTYNMGRYTDSVYLPFSTFNIPKSLIGLETGRIKDSANAIYVDSLQIGKDTMQYWLDTLGYNPSRISADEQLGLVKRLYFGQLPFQPRTQRIVKNLLKKEDNANYMLSYITGEGLLANNHKLSWLCGWIEENKHPHFFVLQAESANPSDMLEEKQVAILKNILKQQGYMEGKR